MRVRLKIGVLKTLKKCIFQNVYQMFLIIWAMKIVLYPEYHHLPLVIKLKIKLSILCLAQAKPELL